MDHRAVQEVDGFHGARALYYTRFLQEIFELDPHVPLEKMGPIERQDFILSYGAVHSQRKAKAVLGNLFSTAIFATAKMSKPVTTNWCSEVTVSETPSRSVVWEDAEIDGWRTAADKHAHGEEMKIAMALLRYTAQRPSDCLLMKTSRFTGKLVALKQERTDLLIDVPCHRDLGMVLENHLRAHAGPFWCRARAGEPHFRIPRSAAGSRRSVCSPVSAKNHSRAIFAEPVIEYEMYYSV